MEEKYGECESVRMVLEPFKKPSTLVGVYCVGKAFVDVYELSRENTVAYVGTVENESALESGIQEVNLDGAKHLLYVLDKYLGLFVYEYAIAEGGGDM